MNQSAQAQNLSHLTRRDCLAELQTWRRDQLEEMRKYLGIKLCRCRSNSDYVMAITSHLHPLKPALGGNTFEQKTLF